METIKNIHNINMRNNKKDWKRIKIFNKYYRLNPIAEEYYKTIGDIIIFIIGILSMIFLYVVLAS